MTRIFSQEQPQLELGPCARRTLSIKSSTMTGTVPYFLFLLLLLLLHLLLQDIS
jgi:hypothetical protein